MGKVGLSAIATFAVLTLVGGAVHQAQAHSGGLDKNGCHTNRKTGEYHCHRQPATGSTTPPAALQPAKVKERPARTNQEVYFANCSAARAAGAAPLHRGDPGYRAKLDRDGDGVACE